MILMLIVSGISRSESWEGTQKIRRKVQKNFVINTPLLIVSLSQVPMDYNELCSLYGSQRMALWSCQAKADTKEIFWAMSIRISSYTSSAECSLIVFWACAGEQSSSLLSCVLDRYCCVMVLAHIACNGWLRNESCDQTDTLSTCSIRPYILLVTHHSLYLLSNHHSSRILVF